MAKEGTVKKNARARKLINLIFFSPLFKSIDFKGKQKHTYSQARRDYEERLKNIKCSGPPKKAHGILCSNLTKCCSKEHTD